MQRGGLKNYALSSYPHNITQRCSLASARIKMYDHGVFMCSNYHRPVLVWNCVHAMGRKILLSHRSYITVEVIKSLTLKTSFPYNFITPGFKHGNECHRSSVIQIARLLKQLSVKQRQQRTKVSGWIVYVAGPKKRRGKNGKWGGGESAIPCHLPQSPDPLPFLLSAPPYPFRRLSCRHVIS